MNRLKDVETLNYSTAKVEYWKVPCFRVKAEGSSSQALVQLVENLKKQGKYISLVVGAAGNTKEIQHLGNRKGGILLVLDRDYPVLNMPPRMDEPLKPFEVYLVRADSRDLPKGFCDFTQVVSPRPDEWLNPIESALLALKPGAEFIFVLDKVAGKKESDVHSLIVKYANLEKKHLFESKYYENPEYPPSGNISQNNKGGIVTVFEGRRKLDGK